MNMGKPEILVEPSAHTLPISAEQLFNILRDHGLDIPSEGSDVPISLSGEGIGAGGNQSSTIDRIVLEWTE